MTLNINETPYNQTPTLLNVMFFIVMLNVIILSVSMLNVIMLSVTMLNVIMLYAIVLSVMAPNLGVFYSQDFIFSITYVWAHVARVLHYTRLEWLARDKHSSLLIDKIFLLVSAT